MASSPARYAITCHTAYSIVLQHAGWEILRIEITYIKVARNIVV